METLNKEFWEKRDAAMKRFMASKERKRKRMAELEQMLRQDYLARTGEHPNFVNVWCNESAFFENDKIPTAPPSSISQRIFIFLLGVF